jgi:glycosyltransferase involved in cell wall biosynthesis
MNVLQIAPYFPPYLGGQERFVFNLARHLVRMGHAVTVLTSHHPGDAPFQSEEEGIRIYRYHNLMRPLRNPISPGMLFSPHLVREADVIHAHNEHSFAANTAVILGRRFAKPVLLTVHGRLVMASRLGDLAVRCYEQSISRLVFSGVAGITAATPSEKLRLRRDYRIAEDRIAVIPVGIDLAYWDSLRVGPHAENGWEAGLRGRRVILVATQLIRRKGIDFLIRAMPRILNEEPEAVLMVAGSGDEEANLRRLAGSLNLGGRVRFLGRIFDAELSAEIGRAHV